MPPAARPDQPRSPALSVPLDPPPGRDRRGRWLLLAAALYGLPYHVLLPPWMGEDEPWHLEYAHHVSTGNAPLGGGPFWLKAQIRERPLAHLQTMRRFPGVAAEEVDAILGAARLSSARAERCRAALLNRLQGGRSLDAGFLVRPAGGSLRDLAGEAGLARRLWVLLIACAARFALAILAWLCLGRGLFAGQTEEGWLLAFGLVLASALPFQWLAGAAAGELSLRAGALLRSRLLRGALRQDPEEVRHQGVGQLLGRVVESEAVEHMALAGGFLTLAAGLELAFAAAVLAAGAGGWFHVLALGLALVPAGRLALRYGRARGTWTDDRLALSADWIESLAGHRTRRIQGAGGAAEPDADGALEAYDARSRELDGIRARLVALVPRAWLALGLAGLAPAFLGGAAGPALAVGIGGVLLAYRALVGLGDGLHAAVAAWVAWRRVEPLWRAAGRPERPGRPELAARPTGGGGGAGGPRLLEARGLRFAYPGRSQPVLRELDLELSRGERVLLEGASGGGKSTLAGILSGGSAPDGGLLLLGGLDPATLGEAAWRRRAVLVPSFHDNHVLLGTLAFNLLMGRGWPPRPEDLADAEAVCRELGLGPLLERMPAGLQQVVGETGWQLSHGERGRLFLARALLQGAELFLLDESFAALDPATLRRALEATFARAGTLVVIAHP